MNKLERIVALKAEADYYGKSGYFSGYLWLGFRILIYFWAGLWLNYSLTR